MLRPNNAVAREVQLKCCSVRAAAPIWLRESGETKWLCEWMVLQYCIGAVWMQRRECGCVRAAAPMLWRESFETIWPCERCSISASARMLLHECRVNASAWMLQRGCNGMCCINLAAHMRWHEWIHEWIHTSVHSFAAQRECGSGRGLWGSVHASWGLQECPSLSTKPLALSLTRLLFTDLSTQLLVVVHVEALVLVLVEELLGLHSVWLYSENARDKDLTRLV